MASSGGSAGPDSEFTQEKELNPRRVIELEGRGWRHAPGTPSGAERRVSIAAARYDPFLQRTAEFVSE
jgi:hypothetical protein